VALASKFNLKYIEAGLINIKEASVLALPFEDDSFDSIITVQSHYHWENILDAMKEVYRVLKLGGKFVLAAEVYKIEYHMEKYNDVEDTKTLFMESGFKNVDLTLDNKVICVVGCK
jgi:ubiquinone/menaquinone biosynthesis C-methylase UbiE